MHRVTVVTLARKGNPWAHEHGMSIVKLAHVAKKSQVSGPGSTLSVLAAALLLVADASTPLKPPNPVPPPNVDAEPNTGVGDAAYVKWL